MRKLIAGNWKMNGLLAEGHGLVEEIRARTGVLEATPVLEAAELLVCPPATLLHPLGGLIAGTVIGLGAQDCHAENSGAHTGDLSAAMLADAGCSHVILGHSERRADHGEADSLVRAKAGAAFAHGLTPIVCVGESEAERESGRALEVVLAQLDGSLPEGRSDLVVAYEPVWAIGTGKTASPADVAEMHGALRARLVERLGEEGRGVRLLYGGSVKPGNAAELLATPEVDGALVGGASLKAADFWAIAEAVAA